MGVRTWNECSSYEPTTINNYTPISDYQKGQPFFPNNYNLPPSIELHKKDFNDFKETYTIDSTLYENPLIRHKLYNKLVFSNITSKEINNILKETNITHIQVNKRDEEKTNKWIRSLSRIEGTTISIYSCY